MVKVTLNGVVVAETDNAVVVEDNQYIPPADIKADYFTPSPTTTICGWKGTASYYNLVVDGKEVKDAAWYYPTTSDKAKNIEGYVAFYKNKVTIQ